MKKLNKSQYRQYLIKSLITRSLLGISLSIFFGVLIGIILMKPPSNSNMSDILLLLVMSGAPFLIGLFIAPSYRIVLIGFVVGQLSYVLNQPEIYNDALWIVGVIFYVVKTGILCTTVIIGTILHKKIVSLCASQAGKST